MGILTRDSVTGKIRDADHLAAATKIIMASKVKPWWEVINMVVSLYKKLYPAEYRQFVKINRELMKTRGTATGRGKNQDEEHWHKQSEVRYLLNLPQKLIRMIRCVYPLPDERNKPYLKFDRKFYRKFARYHPEFRIPEKI